MQDFVEYTPTRALIVEAIKDGLVLDCQYLSDEGRIETIRQIHPATFGYGKNGELYLRVFHKKGESFSLNRGTDIWRLFKFSRLQKFFQNGRTFDRLPLGYNPNDRFFRRIIKTF